MLLVSSEYSNKTLPAQILMTCWNNFSEVPGDASITKNSESTGDVGNYPRYSLGKPTPVVSGSSDTWCDFKDLTSGVQSEDGNPAQTAEIQLLKDPKNEDKDDNCTVCMVSGDDWHEFSEKSDSFMAVQQSVGHDLYQAFQCCFPVNPSTYSELTSTDGIFCDHRLLQRQQPISSNSMSCKLISMKLNQFILSHAKENSQNSKTKSHLNLDLPAECNNFDWNEGKEPIELNDMSPIVFKPTQPDSPIGLDFDQRRAVIGLAVLSEIELKNMIREMESKFAHKSEMLINDLTLRDKLVYELSVKNKFISALLQVQALRHSNSLPNNTSRLESVGRVLSSKTKFIEDKSSTQFLSLVIPYDPPQNHQWKLTIVRIITEILNAIAEGSDNVPRLLADYIQGEVLKRDTKDR